MSKLRKDDVPQWSGRPILAADHAQDLDQEAAVHEFKGRKSRQEAEGLAHDDYKKKHHIEAASHHLRGLKAAGASGDRSEAEKHGALYALHLKALGHDPYAEPPSEVKSRVAEPKDKFHKFKAHPADSYVLDKAEKLNLNKVLEKHMSDEKTKPDLRKFYDDMYARQGADLRKAEKMQTLAKALALAEQILKSEESEKEFDSRKDKAHAFKAIDGGKFAPRKDRESCAHCGESVGHKSHHSSYGVPHQKSEQDLEKGWKGALAGAAMLAAPIAATVGAKQILHNDIQGVNNRYENTLMENTSREQDAIHAKEDAIRAAANVKAAPGRSIQGATQGATQGAAHAGLRTGVPHQKDEWSPEESSSVSGSPEESSRKKVQDEAHLYGKAEDSPESAGEHSPHENIKACPKCGVKTNNLKAHIAQDHGKHKVKKSEEIEKLRKSAEDAVKFSQGFAAYDNSKSTGVMATPEVKPVPAPLAKTEVKKSEVPADFSAQEAKALIRKHGEESANRIMWAAHDDFHGVVKKSERAQLSKAETMAALKIRISWGTTAPASFFYEE